MSSSVLEVKNLTKSFGALKAADNISLDLQPYEIHAIIGPNGAGKSTLIGQICGSVKPDKGEVWLDGENITHLSPPKRAERGLGRTFQISSLAMEDTVLQNVLLGAAGARGNGFSLFSNALKDDAMMHIAQVALTRVGLVSMTSKRASELSHGQRRQLEVAIALTLSPRAFIMDEPMAGLGAEGSARMTRFVSNLRSEAAILLVEHDMDAVFALADRISVLVSGAIIATGTVDEIRNDAAVQDAYLGHRS